MRYKIHDTQYALRSPLYAGSYYNIFPDTQIMQNKANLRKAEMSANPFATKEYENNADFRHEKTNPIQTQFKANLTQNKPNLSQNKANSNPIKANHWHFGH